MSTTELGPAFFLAVVLILLACRITTMVLRPLRQPPVVGEMVAGMLLGPSLLGLVAPGAERAIFPEELRPVLYVAGQIGLVIFMFEAGYEFRVARLRRALRSASAISIAGILAPLVLGTVLTWAASGRHGITPPHVSLPVSTLFVGVTLAITAFPMLVRIIGELGLTGTHAGSLSLASGAIADGVAWVLLAGVLGLAQGSPKAVLTVLVGMAVLVGALMVAARTGHRVMAHLAHRSPDATLLVTAVLMFLAAWFTDSIGLHAVFGAFSLGLVFPRTQATERVLKILGPPGRLVFLPLFFVHSGLNTDLGEFADTGLLVFGVLCLLAATLGKFGACWLAARMTGEPQGEALRVGTLMNARGLTQLIAINVGLAAGIVTHELFTVLVMVAVVTTMITTPVMLFLDRRDARRGVAAATSEPLPDEAPPLATRD